jgi:hypothetical protein
MRRRSPAPLWFHLALAAALALALRLVLPAHDAAAPSYAFLGFLILLGELIWRGLEVAGKVTLEILRWMVVNLSLVVTKLKNGLGALGADVLKGLRRAWDFTRDLYDQVLKPAWRKFWGWFDKFRRWMDDTFGPVLKHLKELRDTLLKWWTLYVRPWLDLIDITRKLLRVLESLHIAWARELDRRLGELENAILKPFQLLLAKLNEVITLVDRVVTFDGLFQRVALVRSIARDYKYAWNVMRNAYDRPLSASDRAKAKEQLKAKTYAALSTEATAYLVTGQAPEAPLFEELTHSLVLEVSRRP